MNIVKATEDLLNIFLEKPDLISQHFRYYQSRPISIINNHILTLIGLENNKPIAYGHIDFEKYNWLGICVLDGYQGKGYGKQIMDSLIDYADKNKLDLRLSVDTDNLHAIHLYKKYNFNEYKINSYITYMERVCQFKE
jgi:ribosomal protein S18 acetylase RimI-like enzyme